MQYFVLAFLLLLSLRCTGQNSIDPKEPASDSWKERGLMLGVNYGRYFFGEAGHYRNYVYRMGAFPLYSTSLTYGIEFSYLDRLVVAPKVQARMHLALIDIGIAPVLYTDFSAVSLKLRPEVGIGTRELDINYGYNIGLANNDFVKANQHLLSVRYYWPTRIRGRHIYNHQGQKIR